MAESSLEILFCSLLFVDAALLSFRCASAGALGAVRLDTIHSGGGWCLGVYLRSLQAEKTDDSCFSDVNAPKNELFLYFCAENNKDICGKLLNLGC